MSRSRPARWAIDSVPILAVVALTAGSLVSAESLALTGGTIWRSPDEAPIRKGTVLIQDGRITAVGSARIPPGTRRIDCTGMTVLAGFWNSHVHFFERKWENAAALPAQELERQIEAMTIRYGFTSVFDIASTGDNTREIRRRVESGEVRGPRIRTTGEAITAPGAVPAPNILRMLGNMVSANHEVTNAEEAAAAARALLAAGADGIKIHLQRPVPESAIAAVVKEAHRAGKPVFVHPSTRADALAAARSEVDVLAHTTPFSPWDETVVPLLRQHRVAITPTLSMWRFLLRHERSSAQQKAVNEAVAQLKAWVTGGGTVLFGSDLGAVEYNPTEEYELMSRAGMSFRQVLSSLTTAPAQRFGEGARLGRIAVGMDADLAVVQGDPARDISALAHMRYTIVRGQVSASTSGRISPCDKSKPCG